MSYENRDLLPVDPGAGNRPPLSSERWGAWAVDDEDTQPQRAISVPSGAPQLASEQKGAPLQEQQQVINPQFMHREHVTGALNVYPSDAPLFRPATSQPYPPQAAGYPPPQQWQGYPPQGIPPQQWQGYPPQGIPPYQQQGYPSYSAYQGYAPAYHPYGGYPGYNGYPPYGWQAPRPKQDGYRLTIVIISLIASGLTILAGLGSILFLLLVIIGTSVNPNSSVISGSQYFSSLLTLTAFIIAGIAGGGFSLYHSIRGILHKGSASFKLPWFWIFLIVYLFVLGIGYALLANGGEVVIPVLTIFLIILAAIFPALTLLALAARRLRFPDWTTTWRRFTLALTSGATLGVGLALVIEIALLYLVIQGPGAAQARECIGNPDLPFCGTFTAFNIIFLIVAIIGPIVEETVKPLAVVLYIGRLRSPSEAFLLGMASGIGFAMVETVGYIGSGYHDWLAVAIERTGAGLLHGVGAGMVTLGWYYLFHAEKHRFLKALGFWSYAVFQHFVWNATAVLGLLPGPVGATLNSWNLNLGFVSVPFIEILNIIEAILILLFFLYITGRLRKRKPSPPTSEMPGREQAREAQVAVRA
ncbi:MAG TPA: hypothetical protein DCL75_11780 [Ktedonobacter sp.]|nr:hypothetical protein [Ktedonobacter sp.]